MKPVANVANREAGQLGNLAVLQALVVAKLNKPPLVVREFLNKLPKHGSRFSAIEGSLAIVRVARLDFGRFGADNHALVVAVVLERRIANATKQPRPRGLHFSPAAMQGKKDFLHNLLSNLPPPNQQRAIAQQRALTFLKQVTQRGCNLLGGFARLG